MLRTVNDDWLPDQCRQQGGLVQIQGFRVLSKVNSCSSAHTMAPSAKIDLLHKKVQDLGFAQGAPNGQNRNQLAPS